jgi:hypothetical protein
MTNAELAAHFAALPPNEEAVVLLIDGDALTASQCTIDEPGSNLDGVEKDTLDVGDEKLPSIFRKW